MGFSRCPLCHLSRASISSLDCWQASRACLDPLSMGARLLPSSLLLWELTASFVV